MAWTNADHVAYWNCQLHRLDSHIEPWRSDVLSSNLQEMMITNSLTRNRETARSRAETDRVLDSYWAAEREWVDWRTPIWNQGTEMKRLLKEGLDTYAGPASRPEFVDISIRARFLWTKVVEMDVEEPARIGSATRAATS